MYSFERIMITGGIVLLTMLILNFTRSSTTQSTASIYNEAIITSTSIGQSLLEEIQSKAFDEKTLATDVQDASNLTTVNNIGRDAGETVSTDFDDIDDYDEYSVTQTLTGLGDFTMNVDVYYVSRTNPGAISAIPTFAKQVDIIITNMYLSDTLLVNKIMAY